MPRGLALGRFVGRLQRELLTTQMYAADDPGNSRDFLRRRLAAADRAALTVPFVRSSDGLLAIFPIVIET